MASKREDGRGWSGRGRGGPLGLREGVAERGEARGDIWGDFVTHTTPLDARIGPIPMLEPGALWGGEGEAIGELALKGELDCDWDWGWGWGDDSLAAAKAKARVVVSSATGTPSGEGVCGERRVAGKDCVC